MEGEHFCLVCETTQNWYMRDFSRAHYDSVVKIYKSNMASDSKMADENFCKWSELTENWYKRVFRTAHYETIVEIYKSNMVDQNSGRKFLNMVRII